MVLLGHESRRIDNQLRGRSGRQGDPGESRFYIGLGWWFNENLGGDLITRVFNTLGALIYANREAKAISRAAESAQKKGRKKLSALEKM